MSVYDTHKFYDNLQIVNTTQSDWQERVVDSIKYCESHTLAPLRSVLETAEALGVQTVVLEKDYVDHDYLDEFKSHYSTRFRNISAKCIRLHFFAAVFSIEQLPEIDLSQQSYLGFSVVRPTLSFRTGRTVLSSPKHDSNTKFTLCRAEFDSNLSGNALKVTGMPFMQQDTNVCVCAEASLWMASLYIHRKFREQRYTPSEITKAATSSLTVGPVRQGLIPEQVLAVVRQMGYEPLIFAHYDTDVTARIVYAYVESEIPVIMLLKTDGGGHAVVAIGHDFNVRSVPDPKCSSNIDWIDRFYIHDDATGPYRELLLKDGLPAGSYSIEKNAAFVVVPGPRNLSIQANDVFDHVEALIADINDLVDVFPGSEGFRLSVIEKQGLIFRTYLRLANDFKTGLSSGMSDLFRHRYRSLRMPRYVWVTEISKPDYINKARSADRLIVGEIVMDPTADRHSEMTSFLAIHLLGRLIIRLPEEENPYQFLVDASEKPYSHLVR